MNKEQVENYITELESMFELSELEEHSRNILKVGIYINKLQQENKQLKEKVIIMEKYLELITDLALDYDGCNTIDGLKGLIDELDKLASLGRVCNLTEPIYENNGVSYNILHQKLEKSDSNE